MRLADGSWAFSRPGDDAPLFVLFDPFLQERGRAPDRGGDAAATLDVTREGRRFALDLEVDPEWLSAQERSFPVLLDPTVGIQPAELTAGFAGNCPGCSGHPDTGWLFIGGDNSWTWWPALKFNLSSVPADATILDAEFDLYSGYRECIEVESPQDWCRAHDLDVHRLHVPFSLSTQTGWLVYGGALGSYSLPEGYPGQWLTWDVSETIQDWVSGAAPNYGFLVKRNPDSTSGGGPMVHGNFSPSPTLRPMVWIEYNRAPAAPAIDSPANNSIVETLAPALRVTTSDPENDVLDTRFEVATNPNFAAQNLVATSDWLYATNTFTVWPALKEGVTYYCRAQSRDDYKESNSECDRELHGQASEARAPRNLAHVGARATRGEPGDRQPRPLGSGSRGYPFAAASLGVSATFNTRAAAGDQGLGRGGRSTRGPRRRRPQS